MGWIVTCLCGAEITAASDDALVEAAARHREAQHPAVLSPPSRADVLAMAQPYEAGPPTRTGEVAR